MKLASVYVLEGYGPDTRKVGFSISPERRRRQLGSHLQLVHTTVPIANAARIEGLTKRLLTLSGKHIAGELFRASLAEITDAIERAERIANGLEPEPKLPRPLLVRRRRVRANRARAAWRFDPRLLDRLRQFCEKAGMSQTQVIESALTEYMDRKEPKQAVRR